MASQRALRQPRVLLVDDDPGLVRALVRYLRRQCPAWEILTAADGYEALEIMAGRAVDVLVTDLDMPVMNGFELLAQTKRSHPDVGRMVHSSHIYDSGDLSLLAHSVVEKPALAEQVLAQINSLLGSHTHASSTG